MSLIVTRRPTFDNAACCGLDDVDACRIFDVCIPLSLVSLGRQFDGPFIAELTVPFLVDAACHGMN